MLLSIKPEELSIGSNPHHQQAVWAVYRVAAWTGQPRDDQTPSSHSCHSMVQSQIPTSNRLYGQWNDQCGQDNQGMIKHLHHTLDRASLYRAKSPSQIDCINSELTSVEMPFSMHHSCHAAPLYRAKSPSQRNWPMYWPVWTGCPGNDSQIPHLSLHLFIGQNTHPKETGHCTDQCGQDAQEMILKFLTCHCTSL